MAEGNDPNPLQNQQQGTAHSVTRVRRRRSSYRRRMLQRQALRRRVAIVSLLALVTAAAGLFASYVYVSSQSAKANSDWMKGHASSNLAILAAATELPAARHVVYPYSVIPGGVRTVKELHELSDHDRVVAAHYAGFDFQNARVVEVKEPQLVYLSYRIGDRIFWTKKRISLHKGEKLITDGKMTARTRCANRVSPTAQKAVSAAEPVAEKFDQPAVFEGSTAEAPYPGNFESSLLSRPGVSGFGAEAPPLSASLYRPTSGGYPGIFPPPFPGTTCEPIRKKKGGGIEIPVTTPGKKKTNPCHPSPGVVPEPGTWLLLGSGLAALFMRYRQLSNRRPASAI